MLDTEYGSLFSWLTLNGTTQHTLSGAGSEKTKTTTTKKKKTDNHN